ncbi:hypothetical protein HY500_01565 [Candidatus Woesearchaeota archaeon]|nr:hypothetical protein [Candidatus Woesearchaeota archaeon]
MLEFFKKLENSQIFKDWKKENKNYFLCSCFSIIDGKEEFWQFDYYNKKSHKITSFKVDSFIEVSPDDDVFSDEKNLIKEIELKDLKIEIPELLDKLSRKYKEEGIMKKIVILQNSDELIWNISLLSSTMNLINARVSASTGKILEEKSESVLKFGKGY